MSLSSQAINSLYKIQDLSIIQIKKLIEIAIGLKSGRLTVRPHTHAVSPIIALAFLEPSTRTRFSFDIAAQRMGFKTVVFSGDASTSLAKGESLAETIETLLAMRPDLMVVRHSGDVKVEKILAQTKTPIINAGNGVDEHPTQALLDAMTIFERRGRLEGEKILFVGDVAHSRVARSGLALFQKLGAKVGVCSPIELKPQTQDWSQATYFQSLDDGLRWSTVCIGLRIQKERHSGTSVASFDSYIEKFRLDLKNLKSLASDGLIMHPGPFVDGQDLSHEVLNDARCAIHEQVTNGVYMRMAVIGEIFGISYT